MLRGYVYAEAALGHGLWPGCTQAYACRRIHLHVLCSFELFQTHAASCLSCCSCRSHQLWAVLHSAAYPPTGFVGSAAALYTTQPGPGAGSVLRYAHSTLKWNYIHTGAHTMSCDGLGPWGYRQRQSTSASASIVQTCDMLKRRHVSCWLVEMFVRCHC